MLVDMVNRMLCLTRINDAQYAMMNNSMRVNAALNNAPSFGGDLQGLQTLNNFDTQTALSNDANQTQLMLARAQYDAAKQASNSNNKISYIA